MRDKDALANEKSINFIIVTGLSGAGKTTVLDALEDMGYYCVDNIPPELIPDFYMLCEESFRKNVAIVTDIRGGNMPESLLISLKILNNQGKKYKLLFLSSDEQTLVNRYKETRRVHPMSRLNFSLDDCVKEEKKLLSEVECLSDFVIDTSKLSPTQLKLRAKSTCSISELEDNLFVVNCMSFGFKYGIPKDADLIFDARCFPNPFYIEELKYLTGLDKEVSDYVLSGEETKGFIKKFLPLVDYLLPLYQKEGKNELNIAIGCTGGKHRSVTIAELLSRHINELGYVAHTFHRDINNLVKK